MRGAAERDRPAGEGSGVPDWADAPAPGTRDAAASPGSRALGVGPGWVVMAVVARVVRGNQIRVKVSVQDSGPRSR